MKRWPAMVAAASVVLLLSSLVAPSVAHAASGYVLTAGGTWVSTSAAAAKLTVRFTKAGKPVAKATATLQYRNGSAWVTEKKVAIAAGKGSVSVKHAVGERTYRFQVSGKAASASFVVRVVPATFTITGSGAGHGVGLAQYGAYQLARTGSTTSQILQHYYPGTTLSSAVNSPRTVKVQVLGPPADSRTTTTIAVPGGFTVTTDGSTKTFSGAGTLAIGVKGSTVTAKVTPAKGSAKALPAADRLTLTWAKGPVQVAGAQGSYQYGNLQVTVIKNRPNVVNEVAMNTEYLYGIDEMPASWGSPAGKGAAALRAQAILARSYVIKAISAQKEKYPDGVRPDCGCHVFDDTRSQNYTGWKKAGATANKPWLDAVNATIGDAGVQVLRDPSGGFAETPFYASSGKGGGSAANGDVFAAASLSYLVSVADPASAQAPGNPYLAWTDKLSQAAMAKALAATEPVRAVRVTARYDGGLVKTVRYTTASGRQTDLTLRAEDWRTRLGLVGAWVSGIKGK